MADEKEVSSVSLIHNHIMTSGDTSIIKPSSDFIRFTYNGIHSSDLGIVRVSNGSRYTETLLPEFSNKIVNVPGADRTNYLGMEYTQKTFPLEIAFDSVTEVQLRQMKTLFSSKKPLPLIFDESPYKTYYAKAASPPSLSYICFDESKWGGEKRVYKGEGKIDLVSFYPYAFCDPNYVANLTSENIPDNLHEWLGPSGLSENKLDTGQIYNPGDFDAPFWIKISSSTLPDGSIGFNGNTLTWSASGAKNDELPDDEYIVIDGRNQLIEGYSSVGVKSGRIYNKFITEGNWFNIQKDLPLNEQVKYSISGLENGWELNYKILYL